ncbi:uncharacterized protein LOC132760631 [Ruditapes philippinarum]|uniref:uncharacterized protein LOC132760631 n=1 Tax=Ruditapes philippinarum TaxID=129788 RepID=UPI00295AA761|nr:uncharacterized protein LOC132760631 [Ruditapes philippinarum]
MYFLSSFTSFIFYFTVVIVVCWIMAQEAVNCVLEREEGEISDNFSPGHVTDNGESSMFRAKLPHKKQSDHGKEKQKRRSKYDILEEKFNQKLESIDDKFDKLFSLFQSSNIRDTSPCTDVQEDETRNVNSQQDVLSLCGDSTLGSDTDSDSDRDFHRTRVQNSVRKVSDSENLSEHTKLGLYEIFGEDAKVLSEKEDVGITLDQSQKDVLYNSYRCSTPLFLTSYNENVLDMFPVKSDTEQFLQVPPVDPLIESCLIKRHGPKAAFSSSKIRGKGLYSQPYKTIERLAYKGSHAARLGIVIQLYLQQSLGDLLSFVQSDSFDKDTAEKQIKDVFSMATKGLDQLGRAGAFHHIIRRHVAMSDTALYELPDSQKFLSLPLTNDGLFGTELENLLKSRKEQKKQVDDLVPDVKKREFLKRKPVSSTTVQDTSKRPCFSQNRSVSSDNFRIPKVPRASTSGYNKQGSDRKGNFSRPSATESFPPRNFGRGRGKTDRK